MGDAQEIASLKARIAELEAEVSRAFQYLPLVPGNTMAWDGSNLTPHVVAVADEWAIREERSRLQDKGVAQLEAQLAAKLRERDEALSLLRRWIDVVDECWCRKHGDGQCEACDTRALLDRSSAARAKEATMSKNRLTVGQDCRVTMTRNDVFPHQCGCAFYGVLLHVPQDCGDHFRVRSGGSVISINPFSSEFVAIDQPHGGDDAD